MSGGGGDEDMNATPISKLPPPVLQTKQGQAPVELPNYRDLLTEMESSAVQALPQSAPPPPPPQQQQQQYAAPPPPYSPPPYSPPPPPPPYSYAPAPHAYDPYVDVHDTPSPAPLEAAEPQEGWFQRTLKANKPTLVVLAVVLLTLLFVVPRLSRMPRFVGLDGQLSLLGKGAAAAVAAAAYRLALLVI